MAELTATQWVIDPTHSELQFKVKHLVISTVTGSFKTFEGSVTQTGEGFEDAEIHFSADITSIDTNQEMRDQHLRSSDFFDAENHPKLTFQSTSFKKKSGDDYTIEGQLTMRGVTKPVSLKAEFGGEATDSRGNHKAGFEVTGVIHRPDFGVSFNGPMETGGLVLGEDIKFTANIQLVKQA